ncbi:MAG TPA: DinB family protein [Candidatus Cybelea sp.]|nr:DinB family protein [Candidatus Cybelea sp.]
MRRMYLYVLAFTALCLSFVSSIRAQNTQDASDRRATVMTADGPTAGFRAEFLEEIAYYEQRYRRLAEAMPAEKYTWRPAEGVRSVGEVFMHIVAANYGIARAFGTAPPAGFDAKAITALAGDKAKVQQALKDSFAHFRGAIIALNEADADKPQKMFNRSTTLRGSFLAITGHFGEHLGQSIAYARVNGIVPPWTEESQQQQKQADKPKS